MFGTIGRTRVKPENRGKLEEVLRNQGRDAAIPGFRAAYLMFPENGDDEAILVAMFDDRDSYMRNADDPAQHQRYLEYRDLMESEPEWADGEWLGGTVG